MAAQKYTQLTGRFVIEPIEPKDVPMTHQAFRDYTLALGECIENMGTKFKFKIGELSRVVEDTNRRWNELKSEMD